MHIRGQVYGGSAGPSSDSLRGEAGGRQADGDREYRGTTQEPGAAPSSTLTPDNMGGPGRAGSALRGRSAASNESNYRRETTAADKALLWRSIKYSYIKII
ncbi:hypothetical protein PBY51_013288 [Eleginops maclovinus]|uniref:Uncharacterized protein n=1 Tax=Eleginops maclovinus TaxID=56733 RepID=A0AAN7Y5C2_ELEMC|nr:hypothetical protein PBY51_013288 [Eleginops maclovinus]